MALTNTMLPLLRPRQSSITNLAFQAFVFLYFLSGMAAYKVGPVPVPWLAQSGFIALAICVVFTTDRIRPIPGFFYLVLFLAWAFLVTVIHSGEFSGWMPRLTTTPYWAFISFRYLNIVAFICAVYLTCWLVSEGKGEALLKAIVLVGIVICICSIYLYFANAFHLPEPGRNRAGTSGVEQATRFSSGAFNYQRAMGTFREPSHLAEWLMLPFFLSFTMREKWDKYRSYLITTTIVLTVSMMGLFSVVSGAVLGFIVTRPLSKRTLKIVGLAIVIGAAIFLLLSSVTLGEMGDRRITLGTVVSDRVGMILFGGIGNSNRDYIYVFLKDHPFPPLGMGLGNGNVEFARLTGNDTVVAFLSMYLFTLYSLGYPGMILLGAFLLRPVIQYIIAFQRNISIIPLALMAYFGYLVAGSVGSEELTPWFGIATGLIICEARHMWYVRQKFLRLRRHRAAVTRAFGRQPLGDTVTV